MTEDEAKIHIPPHTRERLKKHRLSYRCMGCMQLWSDPDGKPYCNIGGCAKLAIKTGE